MKSETFVFHIVRMEILTDMKRLFPKKIYGGGEINYEISWR